MIIDLFFELADRFCASLLLLAKFGLGVLALRVFPFAIGVLIFGRLLVQLALDEGQLVGIVGLFGGPVSFVRSDLVVVVGDLFGIGLTRQGLAGLENVRLNLKPFLGIGSGQTDFALPEFELVGGVVLEKIVTRDLLRMELFGPFRNDAWSSFGARRGAWCAQGLGFSGF